MRCATVISALMALMIAVPAAEAATPAACTGSSVLEWRVYRDGSKRLVELADASAGTTASATQPVAITVIRNGVSRSFAWRTSVDGYLYRPARGEQARFLAVYLEDSSGYGTNTAGPNQSITVPIPGFELVAGVLTPLFPTGTITVPLPLPVPLPAGLQPAPNTTYRSSVCVRTLPLTIAEAGTASRRAKSRRAKAKSRRAKLQRAKIRRKLF